MTSTNNKINLVLASDQNYVKLLVPCIISILYNKKPTTEIDIFILDGGISEFDKQKIKELKSFNNINNCTINFIDMTQQDYKNLVINDDAIRKRFSSTILYRMFIPKLFSYLDRILYLDADSIVNDDLLDFYNQSFNKNYAVAPIYNYGSDPYSKKYIETQVQYKNKVVTIKDILLEMGVCNNLNALSSCIILYNIEQILQDNKEQELIEKCLKYKDHVSFIDGDALSAVFRDKVKDIDSNYYFLIFDIDEYNSWNELEQKLYFNDFKKAIIQHFTQKHKPHHLFKLYKLIPFSYYHFYYYHQMSYLRINPIKLNLIFLWAKVKRFRRLLSGTRFEANGKKVFYFLWLEIVVRKSC